MNHDDFRELMLLSATGPLDGDEQAVLDRHLLTCEECRVELARLRRLNDAVDLRRNVVVPDDRLLQEARQELRIALRKEHARTLHTPWWRLLLPDNSGMRYALGGAFLLAVGFLTGWLIFPGPGQRTATGIAAREAGTVQPLEEETRISNVRFLDTGRVNGEVSFTFDAVTPVHMRGSVDDPAIQKVLTHAMLNEDNAGVRLRAVSAMSMPTGQRTDKEVKTALIRTLRNDDNAGVRREALHALRRLPFDEEIKKALLQTLMNDNNPGLRVAAINGLDSTVSASGHPDDEILNVLKQKAMTDQNNYIRIKARAVLLEAGKE